MRFTINAVVFFFIIAFASILYSQNNISVDNLSDEELLKIYQQYLNSSLSIEEATSLAKQNGYSEEQINKVYGEIYYFSIWK